MVLPAYLFRAKLNLVGNLALDVLLDVVLLVNLFVDGVNRDDVALYLLFAFAASIVLALSPPPLEYPLPYELEYPP